MYTKKLRQKALYQNETVFIYCYCVKENESYLVNKDSSVIFSHRYRTLFTPTQLFSGWSLFSVLWKVIMLQFHSYEKFPDAIKMRELKSHRCRQQTKANS